MTRTIEQERAKHAWKVIQDALKIAKKEDRQKYAGHLKKLPMRIIVSGLGPALAFLKAKGEADALYASLSDWTLSQVPIQNNKNCLLKAIREADADFLRRATNESLAYLQWLNRFAEAEGLKPE